MDVVLVSQEEWLVVNLSIKGYSENVCHGYEE
jgi:hypothetical protein